MEIRVAKIETRLDSIDGRLDGLHSEVRSLRGIVIGGILTTIAIVIAFGAWQGSWFQHSIDQMHTSTNARIEDYRRETDRWVAESREIAKKADERASESNIKVEAVRLAQEWSKEKAAQ